MKIGFLLSGTMALDSPGHGVRRQAQYQAEALERLGNQVVRMDPWQASDLPSFDVIQFFGGGFPMLWIERLRRAKSPLLVFATMIDSNEPNWRYRVAASVNGDRARIYTIPGVMRQQAMGSDLVVCRSTHERERIIHGLGISPEKVEIVLNGAPTPLEVDPASARHELGLREDFILHLSLYTQERKNVLRLIQAVGPTGLQLVIAGSPAEGPMLEKIRSAAASYPNVKLLGYLEHRVLNSLFAACKVFCLPSYHEGTGLAALEAASYGARVVITGRGGTPDYFLSLAEYVDPGNVEEIRAAVQRAWAKPGSNGLQQHVKQNLTWDNSARQLLDAYRRHAKA
jgi:glycosyltransferase involved in cell wall biosynthesis